MYVSFPKRQKSGSHSDSVVSFTAKVDTIQNLRLLGLTVANDETDGFKRVMRSATLNDIPVQVYCSILFDLTAIQNKQ